MSLFLSYDEFMEQLENEKSIYENQKIDFNDEIVSIEEAGDAEMVDFSLTGNQLFYANNILIHNCATNNTDADNSTISDSYGTLMTADFLMFLLQTEEMKATGDIIFKITKNRFSGKTESFPMKVDYNYMRFMDADIPETIEGKFEFMKTFEANRVATDEQLREIQAVESKIAAKKDAEMKKESASLMDLLNDL